MSSASCGEKEQILNEIYYNCTECSSPIEILSFNQKQNNIEFRCTNKNHKINISIEEYINKMKRFNEKNINNDKCLTHSNKIYESYCLDCNQHLCQECLKSRKHLNHLKNNILEIKPNKDELNKIKNIIENDEKMIERLKIEKIIKNKELNKKSKELKNELNKTKELKIKENEGNMKQELKIYFDEYIKDKENIKKKYETEIKLRKYKYERIINQIRNKYKLKNEMNIIIYKNEIEKLNDEYKKIIQKLGYNKRFENLTNMKRLKQIIYNTYKIYNNNYFN